MTPGISHRLRARTRVVAELLGAILLVVGGATHFWLLSRKVAP